MTITRFWEIIGDVHEASGGDMDVKCDLLRERLETLDPDEMKSFRRHFDACDAKAYSWGLWGAAYVIDGGCSDDGFDDFRSTLISQGRSVFESAVKDPDSLADQPYLDGEPCYEGFAYAVTDAEEQVVGEAGIRSDFPTTPSGDDWDEEDLPRLYPKLSRRFP
jgi:hypothetical protein